MILMGSIIPISSSELFKMEEQLKVSATSLEDVMAEPGVLNFGRVRPGQEATAPPPGGPAGLARLCGALEVCSGRGRLESAR